MDISKLTKLSDVQFANNQECVGKKFNRFTILELIGKIDITSHVVVNVVCDCGVFKSVLLYNLKNGSSKSCGCYALDFPGALTHGKRSTPLYEVWKNMRARCNNKNNKQYCNYGAVGVSVCEEWTEFPEFESWSFQNGYQKGLYIDRIDTYGSYQPDNCRFVTPKVNANNTKRSVKVLLDGVFMSATEASVSLGKHPNYVYRIVKGIRPNLYPERLQFLGSYKVWSKLYPESR